MAGEPYEATGDDPVNYCGKVIAHEVGWDGQEDSITLSDLLETASREFLGVDLSELGITIQQESTIILHELKGRVR